MADERLTVRMPEGEFAYRLLSLPLYLAEKLPALPTLYVGEDYGNQMNADPRSLALRLSRAH